MQEPRSIQESSPVKKDIAQLNDFDLVIDALFGFGFKGPLREPFLSFMETLVTSNVPIFSIDVPSGWPVDGEPSKSAIKPQVLISLTAPKLCAKHFKGTHWLGGRFVSQQLKEMFNLEIPEYNGSEQITVIE